MAYKLSNVEKFLAERRIPGGQKEQILQRAREAAGERQLLAGDQDREDGGDIWQDRQLQQDFYYALATSVEHVEICCSAISVRIPKSSIKTVDKPKQLYRKGPAWFLDREQRKASRKRR